MLQCTTLRKYGLALTLTAAACTPPVSPPVDVTDVTSVDATATGDVAVRPPPGPYVPHVPRLRRLTRSQYRHSLQDVFGATLVIPRALEPDIVSEGSSSVGSSESSISQRGTEQYETAAYEIAEQLLREPARRATVVPCVPTAVRDDGCTEQVVRAHGRRVYRRALEASEIATLVALGARAATTLNSFDRGIEYVIATMLQSPDFLFREELGREQDGERRYEGFALASRLSFFLWDGPPDDALLDVAGRGELRGDELARQVDRMLADAKLSRGLEAFVEDWLRLGELDELTRDAVIFPAFAADFGPSAREEVQRVVRYIALERDGDFRELLRTRETYVNRRLASLYGVAFPVRDAPPTQFERVTLPESQPRRGLLGMAAFLALQAHPISTSPTLRGKYVRELILCEAIPAPPVGVDTAIPPPSSENRTLRSRLEFHRQASSCRGCHRLLDNIGLGFENFDAIGRFRRADNGVVIDARGDIDGVPYEDPAGIAGILAEHPSFPACVASRLYRHAWGYHDDEMQRAELERLTTSFASGGYRLRALMRTLVLGETFVRAANFAVLPLPPLPDAGAADASDASAARDASAAVDVVTATDVSDASDASDASDVTAEDGR